jgi:eukaryotic-like serine/threonine-protein kinase
MADDQRAAWMTATVAVSARAGRPEADAPRDDAIGRFIVLDVVGSGTMGIVYAAYDPQLDRKVALKLLHADERQAASQRERLLREAQAMARVDHPNVVKVHEVGTQGDDVYVAMEFAEAGTLRRWLQAPRTQAEVIEMFVHAGRGLAAAHAVGLVHRDFKPDNVLVTKHGVARVADFGLVGQVAESTDATPARALNVTGTGLIGTPRYMAPEQLVERVATERSDQFAFCVALYDAVYGQPPFAGDDLEQLTRNVLAGKLVSPASPVVPARVRHALVRGLASDPDARWPTMTALLAELALPPRRVVWPYAAIAVVAVVAIGAVIWRDQAAPQACATIAADRAGAVWSVQAQGAIRARFVATGRAFAGHASDRVGESLDGYRRRWVGLTTDACQAERDAGRPIPPLIVGRRACLDSRLDALRGLVATLASEASTNLVDHADEVGRALPDLGSCSDAGPGPPLPVQAPVISNLETELGNARLHEIAGDYARARGEATAIGELAVALGWPPLQVRARTLLGKIQLDRQEPAREALLDAAELALSHGLAREAVAALSLALEAAGLDRSVDSITSLAHLARGSARSTHDPRLEVGVETSVARAWVHAGHWADGLAGCRAAVTAASQLDDANVQGNATDCLVEALTLLGRFTELAPLIERKIEDATRRCGGDCPKLADLLSVASDIARRQGKLPEARRDAERSLEIRIKNYGDHHGKVADSLAALGDIASAAGDPEDARRLRERALAMIDEAQPAQVLTAMILHMDLAMGAAKAGRDHRPEALSQFERATALARRHAGGDSPTLAIILINYGQVKADDDLDAGLELIKTARDILEKHHDRRAAQAIAALLVIADHHDRFSDAVGFGEQALASCDADTAPAQRAVIEWGLARALAATGGDRVRARRLARDARGRFLALGAGYASNVADLDRWLAAH